LIAELADNFRGEERLAGGCFRGDEGLELDILTGEETVEEGIFLSNENVVAVWKFRKMIHVLWIYRMVWNIFISTVENSARSSEETTNTGASTIHVSNTLKL
jgi:hypothetical protein